uniref:Uncharacterized protein n=1 Tax=Heterosigma akashiwo TaxID=2829 RepID=A0A7S3Y3S2_HETAK
MMLAKPGCKYAPSPLAWFTVPLMIALVLFRMNIVTSFISKQRMVTSRRKGREISGLQILSVLTMFAWLISDANGILTQCYSFCTSFGLRSRWASWAFANCLQYGLHVMRWKTAVQGSRFFSGSKIIMKCAYSFICVNVAILAYILIYGRVEPIMATGKGLHDAAIGCYFGPDFDMLSAVFITVDFCLGCMFLHLFTKPLLRSYRSPPGRGGVSTPRIALNSTGGPHGVLGRLLLTPRRCFLGASPPPDRQSSLSAILVQSSALLSLKYKVAIRASFAGAFLAQVAQTSCMLCLHIPNYGTRRHIVRLTALLSCLGVSVMFMDLKRLQEKLQQHVVSWRKKRSIVHPEERYDLARPKTGRRGDMPEFDAQAKSS